MQCADYKYMFLKFGHSKIIIISILIFGLTGCTINYTITKGKTTEGESCLGYLDKKGVFGVGYTGIMKQSFFEKGKVSATNVFKFTVDGNAHTAYYNTGEIASTSFFFPDGSVINEVDPMELESMKPLLAELKLQKPHWFKIDGEKLISTSQNDPVLGTFTYTSWEENKYKILTIKCNDYMPSQIVTRYGDIINKKAVDLVRTSYKIRYDNPKIEIPTKEVLNYTWLVNTKEGKYFIGKPITDVAFSFVINFIKFIAPNKRLDDKVFGQYQRYIIDNVNNDPEMNNIVLTQSGSNLNGFITLDGLNYYYCIVFDRNSGNAKLSEGKCSL
jgi:hypothetical protein